MHETLPCDMHHEIRGEGAVSITVGLIGMSDRVSSHRVDVPGLQSWLVETIVMTAARMSTAAARI